IVNSLVGDLINPLIGLVLGGGAFSNMYVVLSGDVHAGAGLETAKDSGAAVLAHGAFITAVINFLIIAFVVFMMVRTVNRIREATKKDEGAAPAAPAAPTEVELLAEIRDALKARG